jgi:hypothetical protein
LNDAYFQLFQKFTDNEIDPLRQFLQPALVDTEGDNTLNRGQDREASDNNSDCEPERDQINLRNED